MINEVSRIRKDMVSKGVVPNTFILSTSGPSEADKKLAEEITENIWNDCNISMQDIDWYKTM